MLQLQGGKADIIPWAMPDRLNHNLLDQIRSNLPIGSSAETVILPDSKHLILAHLMVILEL